MNIDRIVDNDRGERDRQLYNLPVSLPEQSNIRSVLGDITGLRCLDLGCGTGRWTRLLSCMGARESIGIDVDNQALQMATAWSRIRQGHRKLHAGVSYQEVEGDNEGQIEALGHFDIIISSLFTGSCGKDEASFKRHLALVNRLLNLNGRVLAIVPDLSTGIYDDLDGLETLHPRYGVTVKSHEEICEEPKPGRTKCADARICIGHTVELQYLTKPPQYKTLNVLHQDVIENAAKEVGFDEVEWKEGFVPEGLMPWREMLFPNGILQSSSQNLAWHDMKGLPEGFWDDFKATPPFVVFSAKKEGNGIAGMEDAEELYMLEDINMKDGEGEEL